MRILHIIASMDPKFGGPPAVAARLAAAQSALGHEVSIAYHESPGRETHIDESLRPIPFIERVNLRPLSAQLSLNLFLPGSTKRALAPLIAQADVVHLHGVWNEIVRIGAVQARRREVPYFIALHGMLDPWCLKQGWLKKKIALAVAYRRMLQRAAGLHVLNADEAELIKPLKLRSRAFVIPNGVFLEEIEPLPPRGSFHAMHAKLGMEKAAGEGGKSGMAGAWGAERQPYVLFLSRLHFKKGLDYLAEAFAIAARKREQLRLVVVGPDDGARDEFEKSIASAGLSDRVHVLGPLWGRDKLAAIVDAGCFCLPSRQEGFSMAIVEALACGTPAVISENCHFPEVAEAGAGEVVPLNSQAVAAAIERVIGNDSKREQMSKAARALVEARYTWPAIARMSLEMYQS